MGKNKLRKNRKKQHKYNKRYNETNREIRTLVELGATTRPVTKNDFNHRDIQDIDFSTGAGVHVLNSILMGKKRYVGIKAKKGVK